MIICDDASTDSTLSVVRSAGFDRCPLAVVGHSRGTGEAGCYPTMIKTLPPEVTWFLILHADDLALSCFLERNLAIAASCDERVATVSSEYHHFQSIDDPIPARPYDDRIVFRGDAPEEIRHTALVGCWWHISGALINRAAWEQLNGRDPALPQTGDWDLILRWQTAGYIVGHSLVPTTRYRVNKADSISSRSYVLFRIFASARKLSPDFRRSLAPYSGGGLPFAWRPRGAEEPAAWWSLARLGLRAAGCSRQ